MEHQEVIIIGSENGVERKKINLINPKKENVLAKAQSYYSKEGKKIAKLNHKSNHFN